MSKFNIGDKVMVKDNPYFDEEVGVVVGIYIREDASNKYLVKSNSLDMYEGWTYGYRFFINNPELNIEPYEGRAIWLEEEDLTKVKEECEEEKCKEGEVCMSEFNIGDRVVAKDYSCIGKEVGVIVGIDPREDVTGKYLVKFDSLDGYNGWTYGVFINNPHYNIEPYEGRAIWLDDLEKVENESEEVYMSEFNIGDKVISNDSHYSGKEVGVIVGIDPEAKTPGKYLVKFDSIKGLEYRLFSDNPNLIIKPYEGDAMWLDNLIKVEDESEGKCEEECEEDIKMEFDKIREQKKEVIKGISEKVLELTLEIKEMEHEIEKIKKEWYLD